MNKLRRIQWERDSLTSGEIRLATIVEPSHIGLNEKGAPWENQASHLRRRRLNGN